MGTAKPWHIVVIVAAVVAMAASLYLTFGGDDGPEMTNRLVLVDVATGELFTVTLPGSKAILVPANHPDTGKPTLVPVDRREGRWVISRRHLEAVRGLPEKGALNEETGEVRVRSERPRALR